MYEYILAQFSYTAMSYQDKSMNMFHISLLQARRYKDYWIITRLPDVKKNMSHFKQITCRNNMSLHNARYS